MKAARPNAYAGQTYTQLLAWFHDWTGQRFAAVTDARAMLDYIRARLGTHSEFAIAFEAAAIAAGALPQPS